jgi:hypothetical protein
VGKSYKGYRIYALGLVGKSYKGYRIYALWVIMVSVYITYRFTIIVLYFNCYKGWE